MKAGAARRRREAIRTVLATTGPLTTDALLNALSARGIRTDSSQLFIDCREAGIATLNTASGLWVPPGAEIEPIDPRPERRRADQLTRRRTAAGPHASELQQLRNVLIDESTAVAQPVHPVHPRWAETATNATDALRDELSAVTKKRTLQEIPLVAGELIERSATRMLVRYEIQSSDTVREGTNASLLPAETGHGAEAVEAEVLTQFGSEITLKLPPDAVFHVRARLRCDLMWLVARQLATFQEFRAGTKPGFCSAAALAVVTPAAPSGDLEPPAAMRVSDLNEQQAWAVAQGMQPRLTWLWGPPGTGKTTTLAALLAALLDAGKTVLLAAPTNAAADVALEALLRRRLPQTPGEVTRLGVSESPSLVGLPSPVLIDEIAAAQGARPAQRLVEIRAELTALRVRSKAAAEAKSPDRDALARKTADLTEFVSELEKLMGQVREQIVTKARLVVCTTHQVLLKDLYARHFDTVVIDEASMVSAAMAMLVAGAGTGHTVVAGDFRQLSPITQADTATARGWLNRSPFETSGIVDAVRSGALPSNLVALRQQHRMRRQIGDAVGAAFYPEIDLTTAVSVHSRPERTVSARRPQLIIVDTSGLAATVARRGGTGSRYNLAHAQLAANVVHEPLTTARHSSAIGLISPFAPQASLLQSLCAATPEIALASTVHRFQGGETDIMLYDTVDTTGSRFDPHSWFTVTHLGSEGARLLNVAMSRAREQAIFLADMSYLRRHCPASTPVRTFLTHLSDFATVRAWKVAAAGPGPTTVMTDLEPLLDDVSGATDAIEIFTEATDGPVTRQLVARLAELPSTVKISLWYRADDKSSDYLVETPLRHHHTMLHPLLPVYESCVIVDNIVWSATRPILGTDPGVVLRTDHDDLAKAVRRQLLRRTLNGVPGTGEHGLRCACGRLRARAEVRGGPRAGVHSVCRPCGD